jgi:hypothetical protein
VPTNHGRAHLFLNNSPMDARCDRRSSTSAAEHSLCGKDKEELPF